MKREKKAFQFEDLINDFFLALETGSEKDVLEEYIGEFPEFEIDLLEAAAYKRTVSEMPEHEYTKEEEESLNLRTQSAIQNSLYKFRQSDSSLQESPDRAAEDTVLPIMDLYEEIEKSGFTVEDFYKKAKLSETVVECFNSSQVRYGSIVRGAIQIMSEILSVPAAAFDDFLKRLPAHKPTHWKADEAPRFADQMEFLELIEFDPDLTPEEKSFWLNQPTIDDEER